MDSEQTPEANPLDQQRLEDLLKDPVAYLKRERLDSLRAARRYVDDQVSRKLAEQQRLRRTSLGQRLRRLMGISGRQAPAA